MKRVAIEILIVLVMSGCNTALTTVAVVPVTTPTIVSGPIASVTNTVALPSVAATATPTPSPPPVTLTRTPSVPLVDQILAQCPTAPEVAAINADLKLNFEYDPSAGKLVCTAGAGSADLTLVKRRVYQTLNVMKRLQFSKPLPWTNKQIYAWLTSTIKGMRFRNNIAASSCCDPKDTINVLVANNSYLALTDRWVDPASGGGLMDTAILFVHEARHNEGKPHTCGADENTIAELGAWGVQYYFDLWLSDYVDPNFVNDPGYRENAKIHAEQIRKSRFCKEPK